MNPVLNEPAAPITPPNSIGLPRALRLGVLLLLASATLLRFLALDRLPGINGDEAWYGVQIRRWLDEANSAVLLTPSGLPINPLLFLSEAILLTLFGPSFLTLRLPTAIWGCVAVWLTYRLHRWVFGDPIESLAAGVVTACLPVHLAYSRIAWDASYGLLTAPLLLYVTLRIRHAGASRGTMLMFGASALLAAWVHVTHAAFAVLCFASIGVPHVSKLRAWVHDAIDRRKVRIVAVIAAFLLAMVYGPDGLRRLLIHADFRSAFAVVERISSLRVWTDVMLSPRILEYFAGTPPPNGWCIANVASWGLAITASIVLWRAGDVRDRTLVTLAGLVAGFIVVTHDRLRLGNLSYERYILYVVPLSVALWLRTVGLRNFAGLRRQPFGPLAVHLAVSVFCLAQLWFGYFVPLARQSFPGRLHVTFRTGLQEPKFAAVHAVREFLARADGAVHVVAEDWWIQQPMQFLLPGSIHVQSEPGVVDEATRVLVVDYAESRFAGAVGRQIAPAGFAPRSTQTIPDSAGRAILRVTEFRR